MSELTWHRVHDHQHQGAVALVFEHPCDWQVQSQIYWNYGDTSAPLRVWARATGPMGLAWEMLPIEPFYWLEPNYQMTPEGVAHLGMVCLRPMRAADTMVRWVVPRLRPGARVMGAGPESRLEPPQARADSVEQVCVRLDLGTAEEHLVGLQVVRSAPGAGTVQYNWGFERLFAFRAPRLQLQDYGELFWRMTASVSVNPAWMTLVGEIQRECNQRHQQLLQMGYAQLQATQQLGQAISQYVSHRSQQMQELFDMRWHSDETIQRGRGEVLRGVDTRLDPTYGTSEHSVSYQHVWSDGTRYHRTNDPFDDPNQWDPSGARWTQLPKI